MSVTAIIVTRGDVDLQEILDTIPEEYEVIVWDNGAKHVRLWAEPWTDYSMVNDQVDDLTVYGRYAAIEYASNDLIYVQDDDVLHTTEGIREIVDAWVKEGARRALTGRSWDYAESDGQLLGADLSRDFIVCNMPANFRHAFYQEHALVGFGAVFHRDAPARAFNRFFVEEQPDRLLFGHDGETMVRVPQGDARRFEWVNGEVFKRTCDIVFTGLTPYAMVDVEYQDMPWATADNRMWKQSYHREERARMLELVLKVRDA